MFSTKSCLTIKCFFAVFVVFLLFGCEGRAKNDIFERFSVTDPGINIKVITDMVPIGTSVEKGRATLEKKGFSCRIEKKQRLAVYNLETKQEEIEEVDIVWCDIDDLEPLVQRRYHAFLIFNENDVITKITVQFGVIGLNEKEFKYNKK